MSRTTKHDYPTLKREYISSDISIRELCRRHDIESWSAVNDRKNKEGWDGLREEYKAKAQGREIETLVDSRMREVAEIHGELLLAIRAGVRAYINAVNREKDPQTVSARDLMGLIDKFLLLSGSTPNRTETRSFESHSFDFGDVLRDAPPELLRELAELARSNGSGAKPVGRGPLVVLEGTRTA